MEPQPNAPSTTAPANASVTTTPVLPTDIIAAPPAAPPVPPATTAPRPSLTDAEVVARIEAARAEEKKKLYGDIEKQKQATKAVEAERQNLVERIKKLEESAKAAAQSTATPEDRVMAQIQELQAQIAKQQEENARILAQHEAERHAREVEAYRQSVIARSNGQIIPSLVVGNTVAEVEAAAAIATAEYHTQRAEWANVFAKQANVDPRVLLGELPPPAPVVVAPPAVPVATAPVMPTLPAPTAPPSPTQVGITPTAPGPAPTSPALDIAALTSPEAIRSGAYAQHRAQLFGVLRQGAMPPAGAPITREMSPSAITGQPAPVYPQYAPPAGGTAPAPTMPYATQPGGVQQPMGLPTPQVHNPRMPTATGLGMPSVGQPAPQSQMAPGSPAMDPAIQAAMVSAAHALHNPQGALQAARGSATSGTPRLGEYGANAPPPTPQLQTTMHALGSGAHPMLRNG